MKKVFLMVALLVILFCAGLCFGYCYYESKSVSDYESDLESLADAVVSADGRVASQEAQEGGLDDSEGISSGDGANGTPESSGGLPDDAYRRVVDFDSLHEINTDIVSWLYVPGTNIDYPVLQEQTFGKYFYLNHDYRKKKHSNGSVFIAKGLDGEDDMHMVLYAHHMKNKSVMFSSLSKYYADKEAASLHQYAYLYYPDRVERFTVWCGVDGTGNDMVYELPFASGSERYADLLSNIAEKARYSLEEMPDSTTRTLVLSTCNGRSGTPIRFYVVFLPDEVYYYE